MIYFIACGDLVKIGTASDVRARLSTLQTGNPTPMTLLGEIPGGKSVEADLHRRFHSLRVRGEWFRRFGELQAFLEGVAVSVGDTAVPYGLFDGDSAFLGLFDDAFGFVCRAYARAHRASRRSSVGQWWRFGCGWEEGTNPTGWPDAHFERIAARREQKTVLCPLRDAGEFGCAAEEDSVLQRLLRKARELRGCE